MEGSGCWDLLRRFGSLHLVGPPDREQAGKRPQYRPGATEAHFEDADSEKPGLRKSECEVPPQITPDNQQSLKSCALWPALACRPRRSFRSCSIRASQRSKDCAPGEKVGSKNSSCAPMSLHPAMSSLIWSIVPEKIIRLSPAGFSLISRLARTTMANDNGSLKMDV